MARLNFFCPETQWQAPTSIETDAKGLRESWKSTLKVDCPHCGLIHKNSIRDAYIESVLHDALDRFSVLRKPPVG